MNKPAPWNTELEQERFTTWAMTALLVLMALAVALIAWPAFAQGVANMGTAVPAPSAWSAGLAQLIPQLLLGLFGLVGTVVTGFLLPHLRDWLKAKAATSAIAGAGLKLETIGESVVAHVNAGLKAKAESLLADGELSAADKAELKAEGMRLFKEQLGTEGLGSIAGALGLGASMVDTFLSGVLEKKVAQANAIEAVANPPTP